jgi:hypothetical protein
MLSFHNSMVSGQPAAGPGIEVKMPSHDSRKSATCTLLAGIATLCSVALLAGCGGSSDQKAAAQQGRQTPLESGADVQQRSSAGSQGAAGGTDNGRASGAGQNGSGDRRSSPVVQKARPTPATTRDDLTKTVVPQFNPCTLVSLSEARSITGGAITARFEAPQGPTCIYRRADTPSEVTIAIVSANLSQVTHRMSKTHVLRVGRRRGYCGQLGTEMLVVPLPGARLLHITAPCSVARRFATEALRRVAA